MFTTAALHQLEVGVKSMIQIMQRVSYEELQLQPLHNKRSLFDICTHMALIPHADLLIANGASKEELDRFYNRYTFSTTQDIQKTLLENFHFLRETFQSYSITELKEIKQSYWGVSYTRFEWLLQIVAHFYHHRAQLHTLLTEHIRDLHIPLFE
ncbi:DinB family protein [Bacillus manliponensis]|uniref:DinB family protein n=1 Tax=Bacillus manliponensis TaxID=574376 RepID=UPI003513F787